MQVTWPDDASGYGEAHRQAACCCMGLAAAAEQIMLLLMKTVRMQATADRILSYNHRKAACFMQGTSTC